MSSAGTKRFVRDVLHSTEPPPPIEARFFYTSPIPIDDPLSPIPPPTTGNATVRLPPKPFSEYDNSALDEAWHELRRKILRYNEERGEKGGSDESSRVRRGSGKNVEGRRGSGSRPGTPRSKAARPAASSLSQVDGPPTDLETSISMLDGPSLNPEASNVTSTTGNPFVRAPSGKRTSALRDSATRPKMRAQDTYQWDDASHLAEHSPAPSDKPPEESKSPDATMAVGVSRLHQVEMPNLQMTPIYWKPVHDTAPVVRATWFYQDTMLPVETPVANMLEAGYIDLRCWTETWKDELKSAVEVGAAGEMKIVHKLWPEHVQPSSSRPGSRSRRGTSLSEAPQSLLRVATANLIEEEPETPKKLRAKAVEAACDIIDVSTGPGGPDNKASGTSTYGSRTYATWGVIYANEREARLLKPSLLPSDYYGRKPLAGYIRKGHTLGIRVVRGFDQPAWDKLHPPKTGPEVRKAEQGTSTSTSGAPPNQRKKTDPGLARAERPKVTDLILVVHGIGQKLSERMESFHFTHAINNFRREINVEVGSKETKALFHKDMGGIMALPINWRHNLSFEEGGYRDAPDPGVNEFTLSDIMPDTIPSVRSVISDVMLDIPYYMSHHQAKVISAVVREANRVYKLWCLNNPGFAQDGRVHLIAHSLGSVIAMDILSRQPTKIPDSLADPTVVDLETAGIEHFLFNTSNVYFAGSPAGFFLFLHKSQLLPRADDDAEDDPLAICGKRGQYGCLAVENIYNIINPYDPVANRMNAAVDAELAHSLKQANIPSATASWFGVGTKSTPAYTTSATSKLAASTTTSLPRLPSNVELETHNFTREEIAEKRMQLLNDNGQIDFWLRYGGGTFQIQYLTMLGAHSSYWLLKDFVRMVVTETGREKGREGTFLGMRGMKKRKGVQ